MKLLPSNMWRSLPVSNASTELVPRSQPDDPATLSSSFWQSFALGSPPIKRSESLEKRKGKTTTVTETEHITVSVFQTVDVNFTITVFASTTIYRTELITIFKPTTMNHNFTMTTPVTVSVPSVETAIKTHSLLPTKAAESPAPSASPIATIQHHPPTVMILGIVFGVLGALGLAAAVLFLVRRFYKMYRRERVLRKQLQTEGNEMPVMNTGDKDRETKEVEEGRF